MLTTKNSVPTIMSAMPAMKMAPDTGLNWLKSAGSGQYRVRHQTQDAQVARQTGSPRRLATTAAPSGLPRRKH